MNNRVLDLDSQSTSWLGERLRRLDSGLGSNRYRRRSEIEGDGSLGVDFWKLLDWRRLERL